MKSNAGLDKKTRPDLNVCGPIAFNGTLLREANASIFDRCEHCGWHILVGHGFRRDTLPISTGESQFVIKDLKKTRHIGGACTNPKAAGKQAACHYGGGRQLGRPELGITDAEDMRYVGRIVMSWNLPRS